MADRIIVLDGVEHHFPDSFTDAQISTAERLRGAVNANASEGWGETALDLGRGALRTISEHSVEAAATVGALAAVPLTGSNRANC